VIQEYNWQIQRLTSHRGGSVPSPNIENRLSNATSTIAIHASVIVARLVGRARAYRPTGASPFRLGRGIAWWACHQVRRAAGYECVRQDHATVVQQIYRRRARCRASPQLNWILCGYSREGSLLFSALRHRVDGRIRCDDVGREKRSTGVVIDLVGCFPRFSILESAIERVWSCSYSSKLK
jgi:hypothetical protein